VSREISDAFRRRKRRETHEESLVVRSSASVDVFSVVESGEGTMLEEKEGERKERKRAEVSLVHRLRPIPSLSRFLFTHRPSIVRLDGSGSNIIVGEE